MSFIKNFLLSLFCLFTASCTQIMSDGTSGNSGEIGNGIKVKGAVHYLAHIPPENGAGSEIVESGTSAEELLFVYELDGMKYITYDEDMGAGYPENKIILTIPERPEIPASHMSVEYFFKKYDSFRVPLVERYFSSSFSYSVDCTYDPGSLSNCYSIKDGIITLIVNVDYDKNGLFLVESSRSGTDAIITEQLTAPPPETPKMKFLKIGMIFKDVFSNPGEGDAYLLEGNKSHCIQEGTCANESQTR